MLDLARVIDDLRKRKELIERAILQLEELRDQVVPDAAKSRRGRKSMDPAERLAVSSRMKSYWEKRRKQ
jgi:vacuolar-type H+-ATPase subunit H